MFKPLDQQPHFASLEEETLKFWKEQGIFDKRQAQNASGESFVFYDGPPTANAKPALHHTLPSAFKDATVRFHAMHGKKITLQPGWDTHGLPVEVQVEKALGLAGKKQILNLVPGNEAASIEQFNAACKTSVWEYKQDWDAFIERTGRWMDMENPYITYDTSYIEGVWATLKQIWDKNLVFKDYKVIPHCPRCDTGLSAAEVAQEYQDVKDVSVYVTFPLVDQPNRSFIAWTTTPWTLPGHVALALGPDVTYVVVRQGDSEYILAKERLEILTDEYVILEEKLGSELAGLRYAPLFPGVMDDATGEKFVTVLADFVTTTDGSGIVHTACMYGEDDFNLGKAQGLAMKHTVDTTGVFLPHVTEFAGIYVRDALVPILKSLTEKGRLYKKQTITHSYPHCWRCKTPLIYYAKDSWYIRMSSQRSELVSSNSKVNWIPEHIRDGRFGDFVKEARDWAISRERFWGTPLPIWVSASGDMLCIGSLAELRSLTKNELLADFDPHRPFIDDVVLVKDGVEYVREPYVLDVWFDSGAMPFASGRVAAGEYPAQFIAEAIDQTRGWFYSLQAIGTILKGESPYQNVICMGHLVDEQGKKMSKSVGNIIAPSDAFEVCGVDAVRWFMFSVNSPGENKPFGFKDLQSSFRKALLPFWNVANYFVTYANLADYKPVAVSDVKENLTSLDRWILSRLDGVTVTVSEHFATYDFMRATRELEDFVQDLSTWYLRRSRKRDDREFFATMHHVVNQVCLLMAPVAPFMAEEIYQALRGEADAESLHLKSWPTPLGMRDEALEAEMVHLRQAVELLLSLRATEKLKVRQPLAAATVSGVSLSEASYEILADELNVSAVYEGTGPETWPTKTDFGVTVSLDPVVTEALQEAGDARDFLRQIQNLRKQLKLQPGEQVLFRADADARARIEPFFTNYPFILTDAFLIVTEESWTGGGTEEVSVQGETVLVALGK
ncbi:isoleucine--tRNA ligase [soil metagenome]